MKLQLDSGALPTLATNCVLLGHAQKADLVWTRDEFMALCEHMMNDNDGNHFLIPYRKPDGTAHFAKAKSARADRRASWAWETITGRAKNPASVGFYPRSNDGKTRWGAMDFDAHYGTGTQARDLALAAFQALYRHPQLFVVLATSGSEGWHLFVFTRNYHDCGEWDRLLRQVAALIGATIEKGTLEIFPSETRGRIGYGIRAPATWNPKYDTFGLIAFENVSLLLAELKEKKESNLFLCRSSNRAKAATFTYRGEFDDWRSRFHVTALRTRHSQLKAMVNHIFRQVGRETARRNAELQFGEKIVTTVATLEEHLREFSDLWQWCQVQWLDELTVFERQKFDALAGDSNDQHAFRIIRNFARLAIHDGARDFKIVAEHLAKRLGVTLATACNVRRRLCAKEIIRSTASYEPLKKAARFEWTAGVNCEALAIRQSESSSGQIRAYSSQM